MLDQLDKLRQEIETAEHSLNRYADLDAQLQNVHDIQTSNRDAYQSYLRNKTEAESYQDRLKAAAECDEHVKNAKKLLADAEKALETANLKYSPRERHQRAKEDRDRLIGTEAALQRQLENASQTLAQRQTEITGLRARMDQLAAALKEREQLEQTGGDVEFIRHIIRAAGPAITESLVQNVTYNASEIFGDVMDDHTLELRWQKDYDIVVRHRAEERPFSSFRWRTDERCLGSPARIDQASQRSRRCIL